MTTFHVRVDDAEDDTDLYDLYRWLSADLDVRLAAPKLVERPPRPGEMGGVAEAISVVIAAVSAMGGVVSAIAAWKMTRGQRKNPTVTVTTPGGTSVTIENGSAEEVAAIYRAIGD